MMIAEALVVVVVGVVGVVEVVVVVEAAVGVVPRLRLVLQ